MKNISSASYIDTDQLRIGMYVHLDLGWLSHPFPLSSFRLSAPEQIETIRTLGLKRVRWSPDKSEAPAQPQADALPAVAEQAADAAEPAAESAAEAASRQHRAALKAEREALRACERQFAEATQVCTQTMDLVATQPQRARGQTEALARAFVDKMIGEKDLVIRMLGEAAGDKASLHAVNVAVISLLLGRVFGLSEDEMLDIGVGALLHDIGKTDLPPGVRHYDESLTPSELQYHQEHVANGIAAGRKMGLRPGALLVIGQHHEHADGTGFPLRLNSDRMTFGSRIVALVNRYDNLCNPHVLSKAMTPHEALSLMFAQGKTNFDTAVMGAFIKMMGVYPPGSAVQLTDDRYALVTAVNSNRPLKPRVLVHEPDVARDEALVLDLESMPDLGIRRSLKPLQLPRASLDYLSPRPRVMYFFEPARHACEATA